MIITANKVLEQLTAITEKKFKEGEIVELGTERAVITKVSKDEVELQKIDKEDKPLEGEQDTMKMSPDDLEKEMKKKDKNEGLSAAELEKVMKKANVSQILDMMADEVEDEEISNLLSDYATKISKLEK